MSDAPQAAPSGTGTTTATARLEAQVASVETALIDAEVAVETLRVELDNLALAHHQRLGPVYQRIDELDALIAEAVAARSGTEADIRRAYEARSVIEDMPDLDELFARRAASGGHGTAHDAGAAGAAGHPHPAESEAPRRVRPSREAQRLYRELARHAHPDLVQDGAEKERRSAFIARVNDAYARGAEEELLRLADEWMSDPASAGAEAQGPEGRAAWLLGRLERMQARINQLVRMHEQLEAGPMGELRRLAPEDPEALLLELAEQLLAEVAEKEARLAALLN
jgi:hypothetical protein